MSSVLEILKEPNPLLRKRTNEVKETQFSSAGILELVKSMKETLRQAQGAGLAANQVGKDLRIFVAEVEGKFYAVANPKVVKISPKTVIMEEGCLSVPGVWGLVERPENVEIEGKNPFGKKLKIRARDLLARVIQHEIDHVDRVFFIDKAIILVKYEKIII
ncbi:MAG: peptide deformylase [bacterium]|nr:peptide deformylase [bacterium]